MTERFLHKKSLGQHFLNNDTVPKWLADAALLKPGEIVLEIGPGTGALTKELLAREVRVVAIEADLRAIAVLNEQFADQIETGQFKVIHGDAKNLDFSALELTDHQFKIVANIPYYLSGLLFRQCLESPIQPNTLVFLVQKEVAKRAVEGTLTGGKESLLSLSLKAFGQPKYIKTVTKGHFTPPPKVDSGIIAIYDISRHNFQTISETDFFNLLHIGFGQKRKQLLGNLAQTYDREQLTNIFSTLDIPLSTRAEDVALDKWLALTKSLTIHS